MNIILLIDQISHGGAERILLDYFNYLQNKGHKVQVFALIKHNTKNDWLKDVHVHYGITENSPHFISKLLQQLFLLLRFNLFLYRQKPDVVFSFLERSNILAIMSMTKAQKVITVHNLLSIQYSKINSRFIRSLTYSVIRNVYNRCTQIIAVSNQVRNDLIQSFGIQENNIQVINNYVDRKKIQQLSQENVSPELFNPDFKYVLNIGRFSDQKAQWRLIKAFQLVHKQEHAPPVKLILLGTGENEKALKELTQDLALSEFVLFLPFDSNPYKYLARCDLFVLSSNYEGFPIVIAEASSCKKPFIGTTTSIPQEMFTDLSVWKQSTFPVKHLIKDFSPTIHEDERKLSELITEYLNPSKASQILEATKTWETDNDISKQFEAYTSLFLT